MTLRLLKTALFIRIQNARPCLFLVMLGCHASTEPAEKQSNQESPAVAIGSSAWNAQMQVRDAISPPFYYSNGEDDTYYAILEALGGGVGAVDFDHDSRMDLILAGGGVLHPNATISAASTGMYRNRGDWRLTSAGDWMPPATVFSHGVMAADFNEDGFTDVLMTGYGGLQLLQNEGDGSFSDVTVASRLLDPFWSTGAAWGDLNGDQIMDCYVAHYVNWSFENNPLCEYLPEHIRDSCAPKSFLPIDDEVFLGLGDGTFRAARKELGFSDGGSGLGVLLCDFDLDSDLDVYVANDGLANFFYENVGGKFKDASLASGADRNERGLPDGSMGLECGDFNEDLIPDIWVTNFENESMALYRSLSPAFYQHASQPTGVAGIGAMYVGWGIQLTDFDADGDEDVLIATGHAQRHPRTTTHQQKPILLKNDDGHFTNVASTASEYFTTAHSGRGLAAGDFDNDGLVDSAISDLDGPAVMLKCSTESSANWVGIQLVGVAGTRDPVGATVVGSTFGKQRLRLVKGGGSYLSTPDRRMVFHMPATETHLAVKITWPSGEVQSVENLKAGMYHTVVESRSSLPMP